MEKIEYNLLSKEQIDKIEAIIKATRIKCESLATECCKQCEEIINRSIEPLKVGDLVIAWCNNKKGLSMIGAVDVVHSNGFIHFGGGFYTKTYVKFESIEQYMKIIND